MAKRKRPSSASSRAAPPPVAPAPIPPTRRKVALVAAVSTLLVLLALVWWVHEAGERFSEPAGDAATARFAGSGACAQCHAAQHAACSGSHHRFAMQEANEATVLGGFDGATFRYAGVSSKFFRRGSTFVVHTDGPDGRPADFEVRYVFGLTPLQQYLLELPGGRLQALSIAWDARPALEGGQRWFHLYPGQNIRAGDPLHWTGPQQNWNFMCADCHSTNVRKNYDAGTRTFKTTWSEISVGCEACHGPGSRHLSWARKESDWRRLDATKGLTVALDERRNVRWSLDPATGNARRSAPRGSEREIEVCGRCHARRAQLTDDVEAGDPLLDAFHVAVLEPPLYHVDGQMRDEVYNYGSFLQSRMHAQGVTCSDCHDPHSGKLRTSGSGICLQCHSGAKYDAQAHHFHAPGTPAGACPACHMPTTTYMVVDPRHDHSFRVPRPDLTAELGVPNACNACHTTRSARWAAAEIERRFGGERKGFQRFAEAFHLANVAGPGAVGRLIALIEDSGQPPIVRASAIARLARQPGPAHADPLSSGLNDDHPLVREAAASALAHADAAVRARYLPRMLSDPARTVRMAAARALADLPTREMPPETSAPLAKALEEYIAAQRYNADRPEAQVALGTLYAQRADMDSAEAAFRTATELDPTFVPAYVNWADAHRSGGREPAAEQVLHSGLRANPGNATLLHALGLSLVRQDRRAEGLRALGEAARLEPASARYAYVYGVGLHDVGQSRRAIQVLEAALERHPNDRELLYALAGYQRDAGRLGHALTHARRLATLEPADASIRAFIAELEARR